VTETRTARFGVVQYSSGTDSPDRLDFNESYWNIDQRAAIDPGLTYTALPADLLVGGRYALVVPAGGDSVYRTLYRRHAAGGWDYAGGNAIREPFYLRASTQLRTDVALTLSHVDAAAPGATFGYDGSALLTGTVRVYDAADATRGALVVGSAAAVDLAATGRLYVRTRSTGERGLVLQPYTPGGGDTGSGNLLTARTAGGSDTLTVDAAGRLRAIAAAGFGGAVPSTVAAVAVAPTSNTEDGVAHGLLLYGQTAAPAKSIAQVWRDAADPAPLLNIGRDAITFGRLPWTDSRATGGMVLSANSSVHRASGQADNPSWWQWRTSDPTSPATEADLTKDKLQMSLSAAGVGMRLPLYVTQRNLVGAPTMTLARVTDFTAAFMEVARLVSDGAGGETSQLAGSWASDGRLKTGVWWKGTGTLRDARQPLVHLCTKKFANFGDNPVTGVLVNVNGFTEYTFPVMTPRSGTNTDLLIQSVTEWMWTQHNDGGGPDAQAMSVSTYVAVNGGAFTFVAISETAGVTTDTNRRPGGGSLFVSHRYAAVPQGQNFQVKLRFAIGQEGVKAYLRSMELTVQESVFETYVAA
jgi:hypothetical protein